MVRLPFYTIWLTVADIHSSNSLPTSTGSVHKSMTVIVLILVQLNKCGVVCDCILYRRHSGDGCWSASILFRCERNSCLF